MTYPILITGASRGLGAALALQLAQKFHIIAVAKTTGGLEELDDRIQDSGGQATLAPLDITDVNAVRHLCRSIHDRWGGLHLWAHCAIHAAPLTPANCIDARDWEKSIKLNITSTGMLIPNIAPLLHSSGTAVFFDDPCNGKKFFGSYGATKSAQIALARSWQAETAKTGPIVKILTPAPMPTATRARFYPGEDRSALSSCNSEADRIIAALDPLVAA
ncbi:MAG: oxidoreductase [Rhodobacteraceae bacterium]|nr:oxidoreductase [Paracoccaceae bacterium]